MTIIERLASVFRPAQKPIAARQDSWKPTLFAGGKARESRSWVGTYGTDYNGIREGMRAAYVDSVQLRSLVGRVIQSAVNSGLYPEPKPVYDLLGIDDPAERSEWERSTWQRFDLWARSTDATANRSMTFYELQAEALRRKLIDGEVFLVVRYLNGLDRISPVAVQMIDPSQCASPYGAVEQGEIKARGNRAVDGIELDRLGLPVAYWFQDPDTRSFTRIPTMGPKSGRVFVIHSFYQGAPGDVRGVSPLATVLHELEKITDYSVAELQAAVVNATIAAWIEPSDDRDSSRPLSGVVRRDSTTSVDSYQRNDPPELAALDTAGIWVQNLRAGEKLHSYATQRPNINFGGFVDSIMKQVAASQGVPVEVLQMSFNANYSASRASLLLFWNTIKMHRADLESWLLNPIYQQWLVEEAAVGNIAAPGISTVLGRRAWARCNWIGINHPSIDPLKEANAAVVRIREGLTTRDREAAAYNGSDFDDNVNELMIENLQLAEANMALDPELIGENNVETDGDDDENESEIDFESLKSEFDAYGVGVRAGAITPQPDDEDHFRAISGFPSMSGEARRFWQNEGNVRRPITLASSADIAAGQGPIEDAEDEE